MWKWKLVWKCCVALYVGLFFLPVIAVVSAACGESPPLPPEGLVWPVAGTVSNGWGLDCQTDRGHRGIDIDAIAGSPVTASASGVVVFAGFTPAEGGGTTVSIEHAGGLRTTYLHLAQLSVASGQHVDHGQTLALTTETPLHLGLKLNQPREQYFNPLVSLPAQVPPADSPTAPAADTAPAASSTLVPVPQNPGAAATLTPVAETFPEMSTATTGPLPKPAPAEATRVNSNVLVSQASAFGSSPNAGSLYISVGGSGPALRLQDQKASDQLSGTAGKPSATITGLNSLSGYAPEMLGVDIARQSSSNTRDRTGMIGHFAPISWQSLALVILLLLIAMSGRGVGRMAASAPLPNYL